MVVLGGCSHEVVVKEIAFPGFRTFEAHVAQTRWWWLQAHMVGHCGCDLRNSFHHRRNSDHVSQGILPSGFYPKTAEVMRLYSIQSRKAADLLYARGAFFGGKGLDETDAECFARPYRYMRSQMRAFNIADRRHGLVWAWYRFQGTAKPRPDLRGSGFADPGTELTLLTLEVPESRVLLSDFDAWHCVLNNIPTVPGISKHESWAKIFDLAETRRIADITEAEQVVQATMFALYRVDVISRKDFIAR